MVKYYVVWRGLEPGIYTTWAECEAQVRGVQAAAYKSFKTLAKAEAAFQSDPADYIQRSTTKAVRTEKGAKTDLGKGGVVVMPSGEVLEIIEHEALAVDAACSKNPGPMEYRGVYLKTGQEVFHFGPVEGTNNIGEFLAIVHALAYLDKLGRKMTIYTDSVNALSWVRRKQCKTTLARTPKTEQLFQMIARAEAWLKAHRVNCPILKWNTKEWGEIPADFGRK